jgi:hypothetical protein
LWFFSLLAAPESAAKESRGRRINKVSANIIDVAAQMREAI